MSKTIKQIADELGVTKQAVQKRLSREPLCTSVQPYISTVGSTKYIDGDGENLIKSAFQSNDRQPSDNLKSNVDNLSINNKTMSIDEAKTSIDNADKSSIDTDNQLPTTDIPKDTLMDILLKQSETLKQQLEIKDRQIEQLQKELITERQHNRSQSDKLAVLATQAQTLQLAQLSEDKIKSEESTQKILWWRKRKGVRNSGRKKNVCEIHN